ncbi:hypothetical protein [Enterococcus ureasiticus]|uniref:Uncharacterized protein n=1 Tax=Enterococcus ureasiticus TaxID=903984 RepID=A0A1E5GI91_9ENTE|nr:hypothetical protein [Enterococcus ureasiticus]OEG11950.1 hypothetical protein BCR21_06860 [Enterococcus ureasiticus]
MKNLKKLFIVSAMLVFFGTFFSSYATAEKAESPRSGAYTSTTTFLSNLDMKIEDKIYTGKMNDLSLNVDAESFTLTFKLNNETHVFKGKIDPIKSAFKACDRYLIDTIDDQKVGTHIVFDIFHYSGSNYRSFQAHTSTNAKTIAGADVNLRTSGALYKK